MATPTDSAITALSNAALNVDILAGVVILGTNFMLDKNIDMKNIGLKTPLVKLKPLLREIFSESYY